MIFCAIDPETKYPAFAVFDNTKLIERGVVKMKRKEGGIHPAFFYKFTELALQTEALIIEDQWIPIGRSELFKSVSYLVAARAKVEVHWDRQQKRVCRIMPYRWQNEALSRPRERNLKTEEARTRSCIVASKIAREKIDNHNIAAAVCIGHWFGSIYRVHKDEAFSIAANTHKKDKPIKAKRRRK
ncbi:MAG: hypothetical protein GY847_01595 [Proteobacteria bacterium]|nr:hypothetical protein [Pseudomonadota bacterium]